MLNSSANNFLISDKSPFKNVFIPFAPGDNGGAIGAGLIVASKYSNKLRNLNSPYLGNDYSSENIDSAIEKLNQLKL